MAGVLLSVLNSSKQWTQSLWNSCQRPQCHAKRVECVAWCGHEVPFITPCNHGYALNAATIPGDPGRLSMFCSVFRRRVDGRVVSGGPEDHNNILWCKEVKSENLKTGGISEVLAHRKVGRGATDRDRWQPRGVACGF